MADFFSDVFDAFTGQQAVPQQTIIPTNELMSQTYGALTAAAPGVIAYNQALAPGLTDVQLGVTNQLDPNILANLRGANASILDQLNLGSSLPADLQNQVITNALEGAAASGFGVGVGGRGLVARDLGLTSLDLIRQRQQDALAAGTSGFNQSRSLYRPDTGFSAEGVSSDLRNVQAAKDELANFTENVRRQNFSALLNTGGRIIGGIVGGIATSGSPQGIETGKAVGGSIFGGSGVAGQAKLGNASGGGQGGMSMLSGLFGGGGEGQFSAGAGQTYAGSGGQVMTSMRASPVQNY